MDDCWIAYGCLMLSYSLRTFHCLGFQIESYHYIGLNSLFPLRTHVGRIEEILHTIQFQHATTDM